MKLPVELQAGERVSTTFRRHWVYAYPRIVGLALIGILPVVALFWAVNRWSSLPGAAGYAAFAVSTLWLVYWVFWRAYFEWYRFKNDLWILTNQRLIDSLKHNWFSHQIASTDLVNIQDIGVVRSGLLATAFNFGNVNCETSGQISRFTLSGIPRPAEVLSTLDAARDAARREVTQTRIQE